MGLLGLFNVGRESIEELIALDEFPGAKEGVSQLIFRHSFAEGKTGENAIDPRSLKVAAMKEKRSKFRPQT